MPLSHLVSVNKTPEWNAAISHAISYTCFRQVKLSVMGKA